MSAKRFWSLALAVWGQSCSKQKDAPEFETMQFVAVSTLDSIILEKTETRKADAKSKLTDDQKLALKCLKELLEVDTATNGNVASNSVHLGKWRNEYKRRHTGDNDRSKNKAHQRARNALVSLGFVEVKDDFYSLGDMATRGDKWQTVAPHQFNSGDTTDTCL